MLRLKQEPKDEEIEDVTNRYLEFINAPYDPEDEDLIRNEKYFLRVFVVLKQTENPVILRKLLKVIKFYIYLDTSPY